MTTDEAFDMIESAAVDGGEVEARRALWQARLTILQQREQIERMDRAKGRELSDACAYEELARWRQWAREHAANKAALWELLGTDGDG
jgi:hypothetical protein